MRIFETISSSMDLTWRMKLFAGVILMILVEGGCGRSAQSYLERGDRLFPAGKYAEAQFQYRASISKNPRFAEAYYRLGLTDAAVGDGTAALDALQQAQ